MKPEFISIVIPALNEEAYIEHAVESLALADGEYEIIVMDGGSRDGTAGIVGRLSSADPRVRLVDNPGRVQSAALNLAAEIANPRSEIIVRADAHCGYPAGYARTVADAMRKTGAQSVVVPMLTVGSETCFQKAVAAAQNSRLGNGGAAHRTGAKPSDWIDHGHHAGFDRAFFRKIGGYDDSFVANEDAEYDIRVHKAGGRVWMETSSVIHYRPRKTAKALWKQYLGYGKGRAMTTLKHRTKLKIRQMIPLAAFAVSAAGLLSSVVCAYGLALPAGYLATCYCFGLVETRRIGVASCEAAMGGPLVIMHMAWAMGFVSGVVPGRGKAKTVDASLSPKHAS